MTPATTEARLGIHQLKTHPEQFEAIDSGRKTADLRLDDRGYLVDDALNFREWDPDQRTVDPDTQVETEGRYTGRQCWRRVSHVMPGGQYGLADGYVLLSWTWRLLHPPTPGTEHRWPEPHPNFVALVSEHPATSR